MQRVGAEVWPAGAKCVELHGVRLTIYSGTRGHCARPAFRVQTAVPSPEPVPRFSVFVNGMSAHTGGGLTYLREQLRAMAGMAHPPDITVVCGPRLAEDLASVRGIRMLAFPQLPLVCRLIIEQGILPWLARKADVVYSPGNFAVMLTRRPQVVTFQNPHLFGQAAREARRHMSMALRLRLKIESHVARASVRAGTVCVAISKSLAQTIAEDVDARSLRVILSAAPGLPAGGKHREDKRYALTIANDYPHKDWDNLIKLFADSPGLPRLVLIGEPRSRRRLRQLEKMIRMAHAPDNVRLVGPVLDRARLGQWYRGASVYVAHSYLEAFPLTPYEAMSVGVPVVASDIPPHREVCGTRARYYPVTELTYLRDLLPTIAPERTPASPPSRTWTENSAELTHALLAAMNARRS